MAGWLFFSSKLLQQKRQMSATNCLQHQLVTKQVWGNPTGDKPLPGRTACRGPAPRACSVSPTLRSAASLGRVEIRRSMSRMLRLEGAVPELSFAPSLACRSQQRGSQDHTEQWYPHPAARAPARTEPLSHQLRSQAVATG